MSEVTRFYDRSIDGDGPVSGALQVIRVESLDVTNTSIVRRISFPAGMGFEVTDIMFTAAATGDTPTLEVGITSSGTEISSATATTNLGAMTIADGTVPAGGDIYITVICTASDTVTTGEFTIVGHVLSPPTSVAYRA